jgi:putative Flp pilus-assembly TadE/G-like protein
MPMHNHLKGRWKDRRGHAVTLAAILFPAFLGVSGLALDGGYLYHVKRRMQTAADAGAMGGAHELWRNNRPGAVAAATTDVNLNGYSNANATITVNIPPTSGSRSGDNNFVEVIITRDAPLYFMRILNRQSATVKTRAVAGLLPGADGCVYALDPTARGSLTVQGTSTLSAACGIVVDSNDSQALRANGGGCIYGGDIGVTGGWWDNGTQCTYPTPVTGIPRAIDPLAYLTQPTVPLLPVGLNTKITDTIVLLPGRYLGGIKITGGTVTFLPGLYILDSGFDVSGNAVLNGDGVTFFNTNTGGPGNWRDITITGTVRLNLSAPTTGPYAGVLFWNDRNAPDRNPGSNIAGTSDSVLTGALYFPSTHLEYAGTSAVSSWTQIVANTLTVTGNAVVQSDFSSSRVPPPTRLATLVE